MSHPEPAVPLEVIPESAMAPAIDLAIRDLLVACFPADAEAFSRGRAWHESAPVFSVVYREGTRVLGHVGIVVRTIHCGPASIAVAGVQNMCVAEERRRTGLSQQLLSAALQESRRRQIRFGLLFCLRELERFYRSAGWSRTDEPVTMFDERARSVPLPEKNIAMFIELADEPFPCGPLDLNGRDW